MPPITKLQIEALKATYEKQLQEQAKKARVLLRNCLIAAGVVIFVLAVILIFRSGKKNIGTGDVKQFESEMKDKALQAMAIKTAQDSTLLQEIKNIGNRKIIIEHEYEDKRREIETLESDDLKRAFAGLED